MIMMGSIEEQDIAQPTPIAQKPYNPVIENNFMYHAPREGTANKYTCIRDSAKEFAYLIDGLCPPGREKSLAMTKLEETVMWANAAIARYIKAESSNP